MADRHDYYFRQQVTEAELDEGFAWLEQADWDLVVDQGFDGITSGLGVSEDAGTPDLTVDVAAGTAYSHDGERISVVGTQDVDLSVDDSSVSTAVGSGGNEKWVSLFIEFDRVLSDARIDGASMTVYFDRIESYAFSVVQGVEAGSGLASPPALDPSKILLCDVLLTFGQTQIFDADINTDRRELRVFSSSAFSYGGGPDWADGTTNPATTVEAQLDKILTELAQEPEGSDRILSAATAGSPNALTQASIYDQLGQLLADINNHINDASGAHAASAISNTPAGKIVATDVQAALNELDGEKVASIGDTMTGDLEFNNSEIHFSTPVNPSAATDPGSNRSEAKNQIKAWGIFNTATDVVTDGYNVDSVTSSTTDVSVDLHQSFSGTAGYCVFAQLVAPSDPRERVTLTNKSDGNTFQLEVRNVGTDTVIDLDANIRTIMIIAVGEQT